MLKNQYGDKTPVRFWNLQEFINVVESLGYRLIFKSRFINDYIGAMEYFDEAYRLKYFSQLIFKRKVLHESS